MPKLGHTSASSKPLYSDCRGYSGVMWCAAVVAWSQSSLSWLRCGAMSHAVQVKASHEAQHAAGGRHMAWQCMCAGCVGRCRHRRPGPGRLAEAEGAGAWWSPAGGCGPSPARIGTSGAVDCDSRAVAGDHVLKGGSSMARSSRCRAPTRCFKKRYVEARLGAVYSGQLCVWHK